jgi:hypothetical protein
VGGFGISLKQKGACKSVKHERAIHESRARCNGGITFMNLTKNILAANARILWMMTTPSNPISPNICIVVARADASADEKRAFFA